VKQAIPRGASNKALAVHSLNVFETLNARPPNVWATLGVLAIHAGAVVLSLGFGVLLVVHQSGGLGDFFRAAARQPDFDP
jgi:hypothetical protein